MACAHTPPTKESSSPDEGMDHPANVITEGVYVSEDRTGHTDRNHAIPLLHMSGNAKAHSSMTPNHFYTDVMNHRARRQMWRMLDHLGIA